MAGRCNLLCACGREKPDMGGGGHMSCLHRVSADPGCSADLPQRFKTEPWLTEVVLKQQGTQESPGNLSTCRFPGRGVQV